MNSIIKESSYSEKCSYLHNHQQKTHYKVIDECSTEYCHKLIRLGWRRFGKLFFRPICLGCESCESLKIDVSNYQFSKSARRIMRKNENLRIIVQRPCITTAHLELFEKYHKHKSETSGWDYQPTSIQNYHLSFVDGYNSFGYEVLYFDNQTLIAVDLIDILPDGISSIYFYYDPDYSKYSLGHFSLFKQIQIAKSNELSWIYLGYYVEGCDSLEYKTKYQPFKKLERRFHEFEEPKWL